MKRRTFLPLIPAALLAACGPKKERNELIVGMEMEYPPFEFKNKEGKPDGVEVRMAEELAKYLGKPLKLEEYAFDGLIPALQSGQIDLILSGMTATDERRKSIDFSDPYVRTAIAMMVQKNSQIKSVEDLKKPGAKVAVKTATTGETYARSFMPREAVSNFDAEVACVMEVSQGRADAFIYDQLSLYKRAKENASTVKAILTPIREEEWGIGIKKGNDELRNKVNAFIKEFREKGGLNKLADQYLVEERKMLQEMGYPFIFH
ncbi:MAG TPA: transporter substrate-binding domain-containing protein [Verrucomicrobiales bacterium]|nr:transporter substrate-binding domain-containing protein [Verrucomicrobiales bacterium]